MTEKQKERVEKIRQKWMKLEYGLGQTDHDIRFLLRMIIGKDPNYITEEELKEVQKAFHEIPIESYFEEDNE